MSRSRRKTPIIGITMAKTEKPFKAAAHRRERHAVRSALLAQADMPAPKTFGNPWSGEKDGKRFFGDRFPELLRK